MQKYRLAERAILMRMSALCCHLAGGRKNEQASEVYRVSGGTVQFAILKETIKSSFGREHLFSKRGALSASHGSRPLNLQNL